VAGEDGKKSFYSQFLGQEVSGHVEPVELGDAVYEGRKMFWVQASVSAMPVRSP
jgi:hypothetical protein